MENQLPFIKILNRDLSPQEIANMAHKAHATEPAPGIFNISQYRLQMPGNTDVHSYLLKEIGPALAGSMRGLYKGRLYSFEIGNTHTGEPRIKLTGKIESFICYESMIPENYLEINVQYAEVKSKDKWIRANYKKMTVKKSKLFITPITKE